MNESLSLPLPHTSLAQGQVQSEPRVRVLLAILVVGTAHVSPFYLACIEALDYDKSDIVLYIDLSEATDQAQYSLRTWVERNRASYSAVVMVDTRVSPDGGTTIAQRSLGKTEQYACDYYFVVSLNNYIRPRTLKALVDARLPIVAPMLRQEDLTRLYSNYHEKADAAGYYKDSEEYQWLLSQRVRGLCLVDVVLGTYLVRGDCIVKLTYRDGTGRLEYVVFSHSARASGVPQYLDNREIYGYIGMTNNTGPTEALIAHEVLAKGVWYGGRVFWAGDHPSSGPVTASSAIYDMNADFRVDPSLHQSFDTVFLTERDLGKIKQWPLILDEAMRLLAPGGRLIVRFSDSKFLSAASLAARIMTWAGNAIEPDFQQLGLRWGTDDVTLGVRLTREEPRPVGLTSYTFGVITDGSRRDLLNRFINSVYQLEGLDGIDYEILVCGPTNVLDGGDASRPNLRLIEEPSGIPNARGWITRKKNMIVEQAKGENLIVAHTRYTINPDFLQRMQEFGGDFDVIVPAQVTEDGKRYADWVTTQCPS